MPRRTNLPQTNIIAGNLLWPDELRTNSFSFLVSFENGRLYAQPLNRRLTKTEVAKLLKTTEDGVAYLAKKGSLKLGFLDQILFENSAS